MTEKVCFISVWLVHNDWMSRASFKYKKVNLALKTRLELTFLLLSNARDGSVSLDIEQLKPLTQRLMMTLLKILNEGKYKQN